MNVTKNIKISAPESVFEALEDIAFKRDMTVARLISDLLQVHVVEEKQGGKVGRKDYGKELLSSVDARGGSYHQNVRTRNV